MTFLQGPSTDTGPVVFKARTIIPTLFGTFEVSGFLEPGTGLEHLAIAARGLDPSRRVPVRIHSECWTGDALGSLRCDCRAQLHAALDAIKAEDGLLIYLRQEGRGIGLLNKLKAYALQEQGLDTVEANHALGFPDDLRDYSAAAAILSHFGIRRIRLLTNNPAKVRAMEERGLDVARAPLQAGVQACNLRYLQTKAAKSGHLLDLA